jgi:hypothetical protein
MILDNLLDKKKKIYIKLQNKGCKNIDKVEMTCKSSKKSFLVNVYTVQVDVLYN